ncbi:hypothetical protein MKW98_009003 [Papaver atlanticum]|uniref:NADH dehydrogenase [ubiquinone] iron-sulfur protein 5 n=1 Tax=Papaver atlanticum TaxID=357466 RepID=A0AAD4RX30_9MAGN|nr:hypothetical protein MKW98_009003 [Papaver atlanticum]
MASGWGIAGNKERCHVLWTDFSECISNCREPKDCGLLREDYLECLHHAIEESFDVYQEYQEQGWMGCFPPWDLRKMSRNTKQAMRRKKYGRDLEVLQLCGKSLANSSIHARRILKMMPDYQLSNEVPSALENRPSTKVQTKHLETMGFYRTMWSTSHDELAVVGFC